MNTIGDRLRAHRGIGPGFDFWRYFLAFSVVGWHSLIIAEGQGLDDAARAMPLWLYKYSVLPVFFALSGFLVTGSAGRLSLRDFLTNRGLRILPALAVEVVLSAFVLGVGFTILPTSTYLKSPQVYHYLLNMVGDINYFLPGVFLSNPTVGTVNGSLWTVPYELGCYAIISGLIVSGGIRRVGVLLLLIAIFFAGSAVYHYTAIPSHLPHLLYRVGHFAFANVGTQLSGPNLFPFFITGSLFYLLRDQIPHDSRLFAGAAAVLCGLAFIGNARWQDSTLFQAVSCPLLVYCLVFVGVTALSPPSWLKRGDYSYGIYLYGFPIQQALIATFPATRHWWLNLMLTIPLLLGFSALSWHFIERPVVMLRKKFSFLARRLEEDQRPASPVDVAPREA